MHCPLHPHIEATLEHFCWSSFSASFSEVSAASGINFYTGEFGELLVTPGGNSGVAELLLKKLNSELPPENLCPSSIVFDVTVVDDGVIVSYENKEGKVESMHAQSVVMACPKFVVARILNGIEEKRDLAIKSLRYNSYLVGNVLLNKHIKDDFYDIFLAGNGKLMSSDIASSSEYQKVTDIVYGNYAKVDKERSILTLYRGLPYPGGRYQVFADGAYQKYKEEFEKQIYDSLLSYVGASAQDVADIRIARWGHPLPVSERGLIANGTLDIISAPFEKRVFFVEQDNWMLPAFETAAGEALACAPKIDKFLKEKV